MSTKELQSKLNTLWESTIINLDFDILHNRILIELETIENGTSTLQRLEMINVSAYFFVNNVGVQRRAIIPYENGDYLELTSISLLDKNADIVFVSEEKWIEQYQASANIAIEIWSRFLFVEAEQVMLNGMQFKLTTESSLPSSFAEVQ